jgi:hypothetical protein
MYKSLATIAATLAILSVGSLMSDPAQAGASASAPTKYSKASSAGYQLWTGWRTRRVSGTSEYSSSNRSPRR